MLLYITDHIYFLYVRYYEVHMRNFVRIFPFGARCFLAWRHSPQDPRSSTRCRKLNLNLYQSIRLYQSLNFSMRTSHVHTRGSHPDSSSIVFVSQTALRYTLPCVISITPVWIPTKLNPADMLTKPLGDPHFTRHKIILMGSGAPSEQFTLARKIT